MWQVNCNYNRDNTDTKCPLCQKSEDTTEHVLECGKAKKFTLRKTLKKIVKKTNGEWEGIQRSIDDCFCIFNNFKPM